MKPVNFFTDFSTVTSLGGENHMSRPYLQVMLRWVPVAMQYFNEWPDRKNCGHFFGGVLWYGQETAMPIMTLALTAISPEFDEDAAGISAAELRMIALKGLRYLCFTHDTGPANCVRPKQSWGRPEPAGTKWGERGAGFFRESQCGRTVAALAVTASLIHDLLGDREREMLANIAADYLERFGEMDPRSGVYFDTQMEENAWTALGLVASMVLLPRHPKLRQFWEQAKLWMFRTATMPRDAWDQSKFADGKTVAELCQRHYTMLPDGTAENHGFVHPSYIGSGITLAAYTANLLRLFGQSLPPHLFWHRRHIYEVMKPWCDNTGAPHCVQGMDWPYFSYPAYCFLHAAANLYLYDADAALLERRALETVERSAVAHGGRMVPADTANFCHGQQDPALMRERMIASIALAYLAHRLMGAGETPPEAADFENRVSGVYVYPHGGALVHRHVLGATSLAWRNRTMVLPCTREGMKLIGPAAGSMLGRLEIRGRSENTRPVALKIREEVDRVCVLLIQDLAERSVRRQVFLVSLPNGKCLIAERLIALKMVTVIRIDQGVLSIINDAYFGDRDDGRGQRHIFWKGGDRAFSGYPLRSKRDDVTVDLTGTTWVNIDDRCGIVFRGTGRTHYENRHYFEVWHATEDELVLSRTESAREFRTGEQIAGLATLWCPGQLHQQTAGQQFFVGRTPRDVFAAEFDGFLCACNFDEEGVAFSPATAFASGRERSVSGGRVAAISAEMNKPLRLAGREPKIVRSQ